MHNRRSTTTCYRLTMVALKRRKGLGAVGYMGCYRLTMVALKPITVSRAQTTIEQLSLNHGRVETISQPVPRQISLGLSLNHGRVETRSVSGCISQPLSYRLTMVALKLGGRVYHSRRSQVIA